MSVRSKVLGAAAMAVPVAGYLAARERFVRWGAGPDLVDADLPGDELLVRPPVETTRAVDIAAPPDEVWPWLVQMGQDKAGLYSYDWLENLFGLRFRNADRIVPEWQDLEVGDQIRAAPPSAGPEAGFTVVAVEPGRAIVTAVGDPARVLPLVKAGPLPDGATWAFVLRPVDAGHTTLVVRFRARFGNGPVSGWLIARLLEPVHFVMERRQLLGIKARAERAARARPATRADGQGSRTAA